MELQHSSELREGGLVEGFASRSFRYGFGYVLLYHWRKIGQYPPSLVVERHGCVGTAHRRIDVAEKIRDGLGRHLLALLFGRL